MLHLRVHRVNFFRPEPKEINCMSYDEESFKLAVVRSDFSIELWDMKSKPFLERVIPGVADSSIESVAWYKGRLFSSGLHGQITEYDIDLLRPKYNFHASAGAIWCLAVNEDKNVLAVGTEDGIICIFKITSEGVEFVKKLHKQEGRIISLAWHKSGDVIVTGSINCIRVWNVTTGISEVITVGSKLEKKDTIVWCIAVTSDMTIISGDSCGRTSFWDGRTCTLLFASCAHKADVLCLCVTKDETSVYSSGVDPVIIMHVKSETGISGHRKNWMKSVHRVIHTHDVKALQLAGEFLVSGGTDTNLGLSKYPPKTVVKFTPFSQLSYCSFASEASLILLRYHSELEVWRLGKTDDACGNNHDTLHLTSSPVKAISLHSSAGQQIMCSALSSDGKWLAYSTASQLKLFHLNLALGVPYIQRVKSLPNSLSVTAHCLKFVASKPHLVISTVEGTVRILECDLISPKLLATSEVVPDCSQQKHLLAVSKNFVASGDHSGNVSVYNSNDLKVYCHLPHYKFQPTALEFDRSCENLIVAYSDRKIVEYCLRTKAYSERSRKEFMGISEKLQKNSYYPIVGITFASDKQDVIFYDEGAVYVISQSDKDESSKKRTKHSDGSAAVVGEEESFRFSDRYKALLAFHTLKDDQIVAVEVSPSYVLNGLPPAFKRKRFGV